jgi:branched-chain amino acid transport system permease protein
MGFQILLYGIIVMIIGGIGNIWGLVSASILLASAQHFGAFYFDSKWMEAISYLILILLLIIKPLGFSGRKLKKVNV